MALLKFNMARMHLALSGICHGQNWVRSFSVTKYYLRPEGHMTSRAVDVRLRVEFCYTINSPYVVLNLHIVHKQSLNFPPELALYIALLLIYLQVLNCY